MIEAAAYPAAGDLTLFGTADGRILLREFHPEGSRFCSIPSWPGAVANCAGSGPRNPALSVGSIRCGRSC
ncbi:MAG: hypothetical protein L6W00_28130 [Lentisphaeria bacterium]|nr:MAG: hypothetical protein L6W00_28130 [Lentisphaeria bacterium]